MTPADDAPDGVLVARFLDCREQAAFAELVRRHGPMVLGTCRRVLGNAADADDAFQAVFLVLVRRADGLRGRPTVGDFLHGVAVRTALKARAAVMTRRAKEAKAAARTAPPADPAAAEAAEAVDAELTRLPALYREPLVLCELQELPRKAVADRLGIPEGTLSSRLAAGRKMLADRLARRGLALPAAGLAAVAVVPSSLQAAAVQTASIAAGHTAGTIPAAVAELSAGGLREAVLAKLLPLLAALGLTTAAAVAVGHIPPPPPASPPAVTAAESPDRFTVYGDGPDRVVTRMADGFHFRLPASTPLGHLGVLWDGRLAGDFQFDAAYELIDVPDTVAVGYGAGLGLRLLADDPVGTGGWVVRGAFLGEGAGYHVARSRNTPAGPVYPYAYVPGTPRSGRVGLRRVGNELIHLAADRPDGELKVLYRGPYTDRPVVDVRLFADTGGAPAAVEGRLYDVRVWSAADLPPLPPGAPAVVGLSDAGPPLAAVERRPAEASRGWVIGRAAVAYVAGLAAGVALARRWRRAVV